MDIHGHFGGAMRGFWLHGRQLARLIVVANNAEIKLLQSECVRERELALISFPSQKHV